LETHKDGTEQHPEAAILSRNYGNDRRIFSIPVVEKAAVALAIIYFPFYPEPVFVSGAGIGTGPFYL
jgi:hypothetical protein